MSDDGGTTLRRVGLIHWTFPPTTGGVESHLSDLASALANRGYAVTVITGESVPEPVEHVEVLPTNLLDLQMIRAGELIGRDYYQALYSELGGAIANRDLEVVHGHNLHHFAPEPALVLDELRQELGLRLHHTFHETWPDVLHDRPVYREWDTNLAVSKFVEEECSRRIGIRPRLLPLGVAVDRFQSLQPPFEREGQPVILHPARLLPWKGVHLSVRMLAGLRDRGWECRLIVTDTQRIADWNQELASYRQSIKNLVADLGLKELVSFHSPSYEQMPSLYEQADVVVYPTVENEPFGLVPLEAMSCMRPIVASRSGGIAETIVDGVTGFVFEPGNLEAFTEHVAELLSHPALARRFGSAGRRHVLQHFDLQRYVDELTLLYG
jgi:glycosyltransferase involved in cell wall biosynthesis